MNTKLLIDLLPFDSSIFPYKLSAKGFVMIRTRVFTLRLSLFASKHPNIEPGKGIDEAEGDQAKIGDKSSCKGKGYVSITQPTLGPRTPKKWQATIFQSASLKQRWARDIPSQLYQSTQPCATATRKCPRQSTLKNSRQTASTRRK